MMNPELKQKWLEALRSGRYKQGILQLRSSDDRYCCLGVLCDLVDRTAWVACGSGFVFNGAMCMPSIEELTNIGLDDSEARRLAHMNDEGETFEAIAQRIEREV